MDDTQQALARGLLRLLASHLALKHQAGVFLWSSSDGAPPRLLAALQTTYAGLDEMIAQLGARSAAMDVEVPWALPDLLRLSSIDEILVPGDMASRVRALTAGHRQIASDITTLAMVVPMEHEPGLATMLVGLHARHTEWGQRLVAPASNFH